VQHGYFKGMDDPVTRLIRVKVVLCYVRSVNAIEHDKYLVFR